MRLKNLVRINKEYLVADDRVLDFNIYTVRSSDDTPVLLVGKDSSVSNIKETLRRRQLGQLFVDKRDYKRFQLFMEGSIGALIDDAAIPLQKKSEVIYTCAKEIMIDVFDDPRSGENLQRARNISDSIIRFALTSYESIPSILRLGSRDYYTFSHCINVSVFFIGLWLMIGNGSESDLQECALGCLLHDVGKSEIDDRILNKPGRLTDAEFEVMKGHPLMGYNLMRGFLPDRSLEVILHHHEKINGRGYPYGLREDQISDCVKVATIADVYDALTTERPYANARSPFNALMLMKEEMVGHFEHKKFTEFVTFLGGQYNGSPPCC
ncbi:MAG: HD-GYP domain-containing protein [Thermodesulfobacteriota bacterium]